MERQIYLFQALRDMAGYVENGESGSVKFYQDDATRTWNVEVGKKSYYGDSLDEAIERAHFENSELIEPQAREA